MVDYTDILYSRRPTKVRANARSPLVIRHWPAPRRRGYQAILDDFRHNVLGNIRDAGFPVSVMPHSGITPIQDLMTKSNYEGLLGFSERAWKKTDEFHPKDHVPWLRWLVTLHLYPHRVKPAELGEWARDQDFSERAAAELQQMAETGLKILKLYDDYFTGLAKFRARSSQT